MECCPTLDIIGDYFTKSLQGSQFRQYHNIILVHAIRYIISWKNGGIITFEQFEEENLAEIEFNVAEDESILDSIDESSTYDDSDEGSTSMNSLEDIPDENYVHPDINARDDRFKIWVLEEVY